MPPYLPATKSVEKCFEVNVRGGWINRDERSIRGMSKLINKGMITEDIISEQEIRRSPYY